MMFTFFPKVRLATGLMVFGCILCVSGLTMLLAAPADTPAMTFQAPFDPHVFLTAKGSGNNESAETYYRTIDPLGQKKDLVNWKRLNRFFSTASPSVRALYFNGGDLAIGRDMNCTSYNTFSPTTLVIACYVSNYGPAPFVNNAPNPAYPIRGETLRQLLQAFFVPAQQKPFATVAMEWIFLASAGANNRLNNVTFYVFDETGKRIPAAALDYGGAKAVPQMCMACHGGVVESGTDSSGRATLNVVGASFLPFDVVTFEYSSVRQLTLASQLEAFRTLNALVRITANVNPLNNLPNVNLQVDDLIDGMYPGGVFIPGSRPTNSYVPAGWSADRTLYRDIVKPFCRTCHIASHVENFDSVADWRAKLGIIKRYICTGFMPNAQITFNNMWRDNRAIDFLGSLPSDLRITCP